MFRVLLLMKTISYQNIYHHQRPKKSQIRNTFNLCPLKAKEKLVCNLKIKKVVNGALLEKLMTLTLGHSTTTKKKLMIILSTKNLKLQLTLNECRNQLWRGGWSKYLNQLFLSKRVKI